VSPFQGSASNVMYSQGDGNARGTRNASALGYHVWAPSGNAVKDF
jgi:hypothetical protein